MPYVASEMANVTVISPLVSRQNAYLIMQLCSVKVVIHNTSCFIVIEQELMKIQVKHAKLSVCDRTKLLVADCTTR